MNTRHLCSLMPEPERGADFQLSAARRGDRSIGSASFVRNEWWAAGLAPV